MKSSHFVQNMKKIIISTAAMYMNCFHLACSQEQNGFGRARNIHLLDIACARTSALSLRAGNFM
jgi:hypothetical protein